MRTITTIGPGVRLVVFQFLMKSAQVPAAVPMKRASNAPSVTPSVSGVEVLKSTPGLNIFPLASKLACDKKYELVDVWQHPHEEKWGMSFVRFVFCRKEHLNQLSPDFVTKRDQLENDFDHLVATNLWATQGHLNHYFDKGELCVLDRVLMLDCAGRVPNTEVFQSGRDENGRGVGPKVLLSTLSPNLNLTNSNEVVLVAPEPMTVSALSV